MERKNSVAVLAVAIIAMVGASAFVYSVINYDETMSYKATSTSKQVFETKKMELMTPEIEP